MNVKNMRKAIKILKTSKDTQVQKKYRHFNLVKNNEGNYDREVDGYCATGLLACKTGYYDDERNTDGGLWKYIPDFLGVSEDYMQDIINMNDSPDRFTFKQIAKKMQEDLDSYIESQKVVDTWAEGIENRKSLKRE